MSDNNLLINRRTGILLLAGAIVTMALTYLFTGPAIITPLYKAESIFYVPLTIPSKQIEQQGIGFASDREIDGHIQILKSGILRDSLITRFGLADAYGVDLKEPGGTSLLYTIIERRLAISKTRYSSVSVVFRDPDPERAAEIANAIVTLGDNIKEALLYANRADALNYASTLYEKKLTEVGEMERQLDSLEEISAAGGKVNTLLTKTRMFYDMELQELAGRKNHLEREQKSFETELPGAYVISFAVADHHAVSPKRPLLALAAMIIFLALFFAAQIFRRDARKD